MFLLFIKVFLLVGLVKLLIETNQPFVCSGIYAVVSLLSGLLAGHPLLVVLIAAAVAFVLASGYFWLLDKLEESGGIWWVVLILGLPIALL